MTDSDLTKYDWRRRLGGGGSGDYLSSSSSDDVTADAEAIRTSLVAAAGIR